MPYKIVGGWKVIEGATEWMTEDALRQAQPLMPRRIFS
jgi:hypothetical protein